MANLIDYYEFTPCCQGQDKLYFLGDSTDINWPDVYLYQDRCYTVNYITNVVNPGNLTLLPIAELALQVDCLAVPCECCQCIRVRSRISLDAPTDVSIIDCDGAPVNLSVPIDRAWSERICVASWTINPDIFEVEVQADCIDKECPLETCFLLNDCDGVEEDIYATYASI